LAFLEGALTNCVSRLDPGEAQYTCILDPEGRALDDLFLYRLQQDGFLIVSNAANAEHVWDSLTALHAGTACVDPELPAKRLPHRVTLRNLRESGEASLLNLAFQGPASLGVLAALCADASESGRLGRLRPNHVTSVTLAGIAVEVARTGYTGERVGFELYVHPEEAPELWHAILEKGKSAGVLPAGLAARDSTRTEAGLPLFGHELEGDCGLTPTEAGYGFVVRDHVPFFVGRRAYMERARASRRHLLRLQGKGRKTVRPGHTILDAPADGRAPTERAPGRPVGAVTSFSFVTPDFDFIVLAWVEEGFTPPPGTQVQAARLPYAGLSIPSNPGGATGGRQPTGAEKLAVPSESLVPLTVLSRFPTEQERLTWAQRYR
jgi:glycine hydroxymethyltransferase